MDTELRAMVMSYRVTELQALLSFAGKNKQGRKNELQARCLELVKAKAPPVVVKIRELYRSIQQSNLGQPLSLSADSHHSSAAMASAMSASRYDNSYYMGGYKPGQESTFGRSIGHQRVPGIDGQYRTVPICPDITMKELPFYDIQAVLIRPTSLLSQGQLPKQEVQHSFCLTPSQAGEIAKSREVVYADGVVQPRVQYNVQVQLRFCALDSSEEQDDLFPQSLQVKVNNRGVQLPHPIPSNRPGVEPKRPSKPLNITNSVKCSPITTNTIAVQWISDNVRNYIMSVNIVKKLTADELFQRLKNKRIQPPDFTRGRIKEITTAEEEDVCAPTSIRVSVACPLGKNRMSYPCRGTSCKHLQCFDANLFLLMNEKKPTFICPVCNRRLKFDELCIDGYFMDVIKELSIDAGNDIELYPDGRWEPAVKVKKEIEDVGPPPAKRAKTENCSQEKSKGTDYANMTIDLDDDICIVEEDVPSSSGVHGSASKSGNTSKSVEPEVIDLIDSSDSESEEKPSRPLEPSRTPLQNTVHTTPLPQQQQEVEETEDDKKTDNDEDDSDDEIRRRPRRRATKVNYVEDSSSDSSTNDGVKEGRKSKSRRATSPGSPAYIELSDSASSPESQQRPFAAVSGIRSSSTSSHPNNNRSGSGSSTLYSSSVTTAPTGIGLHSSSTTSSFNQLPSSQSTLLLNPSPIQPNLSSSLYLPPSTSTSVPGYPSYDARSGWEADLNSFINLQSPQLNYGHLDLSSYGYLNSSASAHHSSSSRYSGPGHPPTSGGSAGGGYSGWI